MLPATLMLTACQSTTPKPAISGSAFSTGYCTIETLQTYDPVKDTPETIRQVLIHNAKYHSVCGSTK
jgi:hypothetical protein